MKQCRDSRKDWSRIVSYLHDQQRGQRALRGIAIGRRAWLFAGSDRGGERAATVYTLIATAKLNGLDPRAWLADVLRRINDHPASRLNELLPWNCRATAMTDAQAA